MVSTRKKRGQGGKNNSPSPANTNPDGISVKGARENSSAWYEQARNQKIQENKEKMEKLGIVDLSLQLKSRSKTPRNVSKPRTTPLPISSSPTRRSPRLKTLPPVNYCDKLPKTSLSNSLEIHLPEGSKPEVYTEEHEKLLGGCLTAWTLSVDGYDEDGKRIYDSETGETCHQCRQKTLGLHTHCSKCNLVQGQFCGDCLYMRYGENVIEANQNPNWICPVCRDICNCSLCRKVKGWLPTGSLYRKVLKLGFKSVAHYLIQTHRSQNHSEDSVAETLDSQEITPPSKDKKSVPFDLNDTLILDDSLDDEHEKEMKQEEKQVISSDSTMYFDADDGYSEENSSNAIK